MSAADALILAQTDKIVLHLSNLLPICPMLPLLLLPLLTSWFLVARCQQWAGEVIPNSLEQRTGAEIAYFNIKDAAGGNTTLINYMSKPTTTGQRLNTTKVLRGVIVLNGQLRNGMSSSRSGESCSSRNLDSE